MSEFVGQLPWDMGRDIVKVSKTAADRRKNFLNIMETFSELSKIFSSSYLVKPEPLSVWEKFIRIFKPKDKKYESLKYSCSPHELESILTLINVGSKKLTESFQKVGLLKKREKIKLEFLGKGCSGSAFKITFPKRTKYKPKVLKIFSKSEFERMQRPNKLFNVESPFHEINSMIFIKNKHKNNGFKNLQYVEGYVASLRNRFMLLKDAYNYRNKDLNPHYKLDEKLKLMLWDKSNDGNILNGRLIDYGYIQQFEKMSHFLFLNRGIRK